MGVCSESDGCAGCTRDGDGNAVAGDADCQWGGAYGECRLKDDSNHCERSDNDGDVGPIVGGVVAVLILLCLVLLRRRCIKARAHASSRENGPSQQLSPLELARSIEARKSVEARANAKNELHKAMFAVADELEGRYSQLRDPSGDVRFEAKDLIFGRPEQVPARACVPTCPLSLLHRPRPCVTPYYVY